jgi:hypothetical protein
VWSYLGFSGPKLWFTIEPSWHHHFKSDRIGVKLLRELSEDERAFFGHPHARFRVAHPTFHSVLTMPRGNVRRDKAIACVNNFGGRFWYLSSHFRKRNKFVVNEKVSLFGSPEAWGKFRDFPRFWRKGPPKNFSGCRSPGSSCFDEQHIRFLSGFKVCVCLENCSENLYFTEKFVNAVRAGCIPVYHAHESVKDMFLRDAIWVDPADFAHSAEKTIDFALGQERRRYQEQNDRWLASGVIDRTDNNLVLLALHGIIREKLSLLIA